MSDPATVFQFFSWHRTGIAGSLTTPDAVGIAATAQLAVTLEVNGGALEPVQIAVLGPGDARGFDARQVVRTVPEAGATQFESNLFAAVEFARPDFPWILTPAAAVSDRLRPWLVLVVVKLQPGVALAAKPIAGTQAGVLVLSIDSPAVPGAELPSLATSWALAHAQATAAAGPDVTLDGLDPGRVRSRLLCPRPLAPQTDYIACVVPAFAIGCKVALGQSIEDADRGQLAPAWTGSEKSIQLPVYYSWPFSTGAGGDFRSLARQLAPRALPAGTGVRKLDLTHAGFTLLNGGTADMPGVLAPLGQSPPVWTGPLATAFRKSLGGVLGLRGTASTPLLTPPTYGATIADTTATSANAPPWLTDLNLDPRYRAFAGAGARVVEQQQEALLAEAWRQIGDVQRANRIVHVAQLTRGALGSVVKRRLARMSFDDRLGITWPMHTRVKLQTGVGTPPTTLAASLKSSPARRPSGAAVRRATRARGVTVSCTTAPLPAPLRAQTPALVTLDDGRVLLIDGGQNPSGETLIFNASANKWSSAGKLPVPLAFDVAAIKLADGRVFAYGGGTPHGVAQIFDPASGWRSATSSPFPGGRNMLALLPDGRVLVCALTSGIYDPKKDAWQSGPWADPFISSRTGATLTALDNGKVLLAGGINLSPGVALNCSAALFDPVTATWSPTGNMIHERAGHEAVKLRDGRVLVFGGGGAGNAGADIYDPKTATWRAAATTPGRFQPHGVLLSDGSVLKIGGLPAHGDCDTTEIYRPELDRWEPGPPTTAGVASGGNLAIARLPDDRVLAVTAPWGIVTPPSTVADLLVPIPLPRFVAQPVSIASFFSNAGKKLLGGSSASARGVLTWPLPGQLSGTDPASLALRQQLQASATATAVPSPAFDDGQRARYDAALTATMNVDTTIAKHLATRITVPSGTQPMQPIISGPDFTQPMFAGLRDQDRDFILPGLSAVPPHTLALLQVNPTAIEAYLVGLNEALGRMLRWRGYPTDQRGTAFRQFWDTGTSLPADQRDIAALATWGHSALGSHLRARGGLVLLVRSPLLQRYPDTAVSMVQATWANGKHALGTTEKQPVYRAAIPPDVTFLAFDITAADAFGDPNPANQRAGWFFTFAQHPTAPEFGVDVGASAPDPASTSNAAQLAAGTLRLPTRVAIHASGLHI